MRGGEGRLKLVGGGGKDTIEGSQFRLIGLSKHR